MNDGKNNTDAEFAALRLSTERLVNGLRQMCETQATHTDMLQSILVAATAPVEGDSDLADTLAKIVAAIEGQTLILAAIRKALVERN